MIRVEIENKNNKSVLHIRGKIDLSSARNLENSFKEAIEEKPEAIYLDLSETDYIDSSGIGSIIKCMNKSKKEGVAFGCCDPGDDVLSIFKIAKLDGYLNLTSLKDVF